MPGRPQGRPLSDRDTREGSLHPGDGCAAPVLHVRGGRCLVIITLIIPWGVFTRYVLNSASSWPEPMAVLLMIWFSFLSAVVCYRENLHIGVGIMPRCCRMRQGAPRLAHRSLHDGHQPVHALVRHQARADHVVPVHRRFPLVSVGVSYLPVPIGGAITSLFVIERLRTRQVLRGARAGNRGNLHRIGRHNREPQPWMS